MPLISKLLIFFFSWKCKYKNSFLLPNKISQANLSSKLLIHFKVEQLPKLPSNPNNPCLDHWGSTFSEILNQNLTNKKESKLLSYETTGQENCYNYR